MKKIRLSLLLFLLGITLFGADFAPYKMFGSHMVLQQDKAVTFAGTAPAGKILTLTFADNKREVTTGEDGIWSAEFPAMKAGLTPYDLTISDGKEKIVLSDILIGEVWFCSGQSNMEMPIRASWSQFFSAKNADEEVKNANYPQIRMLTVNKVPSVTPEKNIGTPGWQVCSPQTVASFSACAYFFGRELNKDLQIPVGLILSRWGGSSILPWISEETLKNGDQEQYKNIISLEEESGDISPFYGQYNKMSNALKTIIQKANQSKKFDELKAADFNDSDWKAFKNGDSIPADGIYFLRTKFTIPENLKGKNLQINLGKIAANQIGKTGNNYMEIYVNGRLIWKTNLNDAYGFIPNMPGGTIPADLIRQENHVAVRIISLTGAPVFAGKDSPAVSGAGKTIPLQQWKLNAEVQGIKLPPLANFRLFDLRQPSLLFNGMVAPFRYSKIRGILWYQGEADIWMPRYWLWNKLLIENWRGFWQDADLPFLLVQLAGFERSNLRNPLPDDYWMKKPPVAMDGWALIREIQSEMPKIFKNVGMAVAMDVGEHSNIHPADKQTVGFRLAKLAEKIAYGKDIVCEGPTFAKAEFANGKAIVHFDNIGGGLTTKDGKAPGAFVLAHRPEGKTVFVAATAKIVGDTVEVTAPGVSTPTAVRYAFTTYRGDVNLMNKEGFPVAPFRSDKGEYASRFKK
ncbi:MAG: hypothetical protein LBM70_03385 [Victivallales bacterium]|jgi:sialate O-acetylesterase|nr:hypothetical protein [Victivallales bacterium]